MINKLTLFALIFCMSIGILTAQEVAFKDDKIFIDGKAIFKYEKTNIIHYSFYTLQGDEILLYKGNDNQTENSDDDFYTLNFVAAKKKIESHDFTLCYAGMGVSYKKNAEKVISWLIKEKVMDANGEINVEKLETFKDKYDEKITERTIIIK